MRNVLKRKWWLILLILIPLLIVILTVKNGSNAVQVREVEMKSMVVTRTIASSGSIRADNELDLSFPLSGTLEAVYVTKGDRISKGTLLAKIDNSAMLHTVQTYRDARDIALREKDLFVVQFGSEKRSRREQEEYDIRIRTLDERISQAEAAYQAQLSQANNTWLYASMDGTVLDVLMKAGEVVAPGMPIVKVADLDKLYFEIIVDQEEIGLISRYQEAELSLEAFSGTVFNAYVDRIPLFANAPGGFAIKLAIENISEHDVKVGMRGDVRVITDSTSDNVNALEYDQVFISESGSHYIWVVNEKDELEKFYVEIGVEGDLYTEIRSSVDRKIVVPVETGRIEEGSKAQIIS
jgi:RND family efflux transporter MFP subunit